ncbi:hypothetical protein BH23BAC4_BH23BAC4_14130 [soil metagenome]
MISEEANGRNNTRLNQMKMPPPLRGGGIEIRNETLWFTRGPHSFSSPKKFVLLLAEDL